MPTRDYKASWSSTEYRYGMNTQEKSPELQAFHTTALFWEYDSRIGRRWNVDPVVKPWESPYMCFGDNPITGTDALGNTTEDPSNISRKEGTQKAKVYAKQVGEVSNANNGTVKYSITTQQDVTTKGKTVSTKYTANYEQVGNNDVKLVSQTKTTTTIGSQITYVPSSFGVPTPIEVSKTIVETKNLTPLEAKAFETRNNTFQAYITENPSAIRDASLDRQGKQADEIAASLTKWADRLEHAAVSSGGVALLLTEGSLGPQAVATLPSAATCGIGAFGCEVTSITLKVIASSYSDKSNLKGDGNVPYPLK
jgi:hypothetical protein